MQTLESFLKRDYWFSIGALILLLVLAWSWLLAGAGMGMTAMDMTRMPADMPMPVADWTPAYVVLMFCMWWIMMIAMMLPSTAPVILLAAALNRRVGTDNLPYGASIYFACGYLLAWGFFSLLAVVAQWQLQNSGLLSGTLVITDSTLAGVLLIAAAIWQLTPLKQACLRQCRDPIRFLTARKRSGNRGALMMGLEHGAYCLGCCWFLMALLFVGGVMNLYWIIGLAVFVAMEKLLPFGRQAGMLVAVGLGVWGLLLVIA
ncbi:MAG: DUF2182 domain-containing protein [Gammaproteobacteria bacterium]